MPHDVIPWEGLIKVRNLHKIQFEVLWFKIVNFTGINNLHLTFEVDILFVLTYNIPIYRNVINNIFELSIEHVGTKIPC